MYLGSLRDLLKQENSTFNVKHYIEDVTDDIELSKDGWGHHSPMYFYNAVFFYHSKSEKLLTSILYKNTWNSLYS